MIIMIWLYLWKAMALMCLLQIPPHLGYGAQVLFPFAIKRLGEFLMRTRRASRGVQVNAMKFIGMHEKVLVCQPSEFDFCFGLCRARHQQFQVRMIFK